MIGIYKITNSVNGKVYIGQTKNFSHRKACHVYDLKNNRHSNPYLQADFNGGSSEFKFEMLCKCKVEDLDDLETFYINKYKSYDRGCGYNIDKASSGNGIKAQETIDRMSSAKIGNTAMCGIKLSDEWKKHLSEAQPHRRKIQCIETGTIYESFADAARKTGLNRTKIVSVCTGKRNMTGGFHFKYADERTSD